VILAALDFDQTGTYALDEAARVANRGGHTELHLVHAVHHGELAEQSVEHPAAQAQLQQLTKEIERRVAAMWTTHSRQVIAHIHIGTPAQAILQTAADIGADLLVVGTHQRKGLERLMLGSVAARVLHDAQCPVLVARPRDYAALAASQSIQPPCPDCIDVRSQSEGAIYWCERHTRTRLSPHVYEPHDRGRNSLMPVT
jgi:nucleotide-binding universal stress UspA family protein